MESTLYFFNKEQKINAQNSINNGTRTEGGLPVEGVKQISFAHGPSYNIFLSIFLASYLQKLTLEIRQNFFLH